VNCSVDRTKPGVRLTSPTGGTVTGTITLSANASDNSGIEKVEFLYHLNEKLNLSGSSETLTAFLDPPKLIGASTSPPYSVTWHPPALCRYSVTMETWAYDTCGNVGEAAWVFITLCAGNQGERPGGGVTFTSSVEPADTVVEMQVNARTLALHAGLNLGVFDERRGTNMVTARVVSARSPGAFWEMRLDGAGFRPGSLRATRGVVAAVGASSIRFALTGNVGEVVSFAFESSEPSGAPQEIKP
jgi:hypothetical protein